MYEQPKEELRKGARFDCVRFVCSCTLRPDSPLIQSDNNKRHGAVLLNVCPQGICLETNFEPSEGSRLRFEMRPIVGPEVIATIRVMHTQPSATSGFYIVGSEFAELGEEDSRNLLMLLDTIKCLEEDLT
ncbi:PilZ domain-containing protein [Candidatus Poribacteria bacterium]|nr:PilZ domain-containing protein [Candidatus Poribacteria bacterium]